MLPIIPIAKKCCIVLRGLRSNYITIFVWAILKKNWAIFLLIPSIYYVSENKDVFSCERAVFPNSWIMNYKLALLKQLHLALALKWWLWEVADRLKIKKWQFVNALKKNICWSLSIFANYFETGFLWSSQSDTSSTACFFEILLLLF